MAGGVLAAVELQPGRAARLGEMMSQVLRLPRTFLALRKLVGEDFAVGVLDANLWAFWGFHEGSDDGDCRARRWTKARPGAVEPRQVTGLSVREMVLMMRVAMELEEPIQEYSRQNGEGFRVLLPSLSRFMGMSHQEEVDAAGRRLPWCESPWCAEERRHANTFARIIERLSGLAPGRGNPNQPREVTCQEADAVQMLLSREAAEWNSSSTYLVMAAHGTGELRTLVRNMARDEIKHLSILSAAQLYLFGPRPWQRFQALVKTGLNEYRGQKRKRSGGDQLGTNPITAFEVIVCHLLTERSIRRWLKGLPARTLARIFERPQDAGEGQAQRMSLMRWERKARDR